LPEVDWYEVTLLDVSQLLPLDTFVGMLLVFALSLLVALGAFNWLLGRVVLTPLSRLSRAIQQVQDDNFEPHDLPPGGKDEIGQLTRLFESMAHRVWVSRNELEARVQERTVALEHSQALYQSVLLACPDGVVITDLQGKIEHVSPSTLNLLGCQQERLVGHNIEEFRDPIETERALANISAMFEGVYRGAEEYRVVRPDGVVLDTEINAEIIRDSTGQSTGLIFVVRDVAERKKIRESLQYMAQHDHLTGLPNRALATDRLRHGLATVRRDQTRLALLFVDLDHFKPINDQFGHAVGDELLQQVAKRMLACVRESDTLARVGGDEFMLILRSAGEQADTAVMAVAEKIRLALNQAFEVTGQRLMISCSIGIAIYPGHGSDDVELTAHADLAMYQAKQAGRNQVRWYAVQTGVADEPSLAGAVCGNHEG
jgi:diguanylate cyclase (GGDEF)-like protein/PAS domain S-box-containing protein